MSPTASARLFDLAKVVAVVFAIAAAWTALNYKVSSLAAEKLDASRFVADSIRHTDDLRDIRMGVNEANERLREIQCGLPARAGCR